MILGNPEIRPRLEVEVSHPPTVTVLQPTHNPNIYIYIYVSFCVYIYIYIHKKTQYNYIDNDSGMLHIYMCMFDVCVIKCDNVACDGL